MANSMDDIKKSFWKEEEEVIVIADFIAFWNSLSDEDREHLKNADLKEIMKF